MSERVVSRGVRPWPGTIEPCLLYADARQRVLSSPRLSKYKDIILGDWPEGDDHLRWVIGGKVSEIVAWAKQIREDSE